MVWGITYIRTWEGWLFLATVIDIASRRVVGFAMAEHLRTELISDALANAAAARSPAPGVIFHSDRGCQTGFNRSSQWWITRAPGVGIDLQSLTSQSPADAVGRSDGDGTKLATVSATRLPSSTASPSSQTPPRSLPQSSRGSAGASPTGAGSSVSRHSQQLGDDRCPGPATPAINPDREVFASRERGWSDERPAGLYVA
jgi:hypothetical protein